jgi:hypothetical protein
MSRRAYRAMLAAALAVLVVAFCYLAPRWALVGPRLVEWAAR